MVGLSRALSHAGALPNAIANANAIPSCVAPLFIRHGGDGVNTER